MKQYTSLHMRGDTPVSDHPLSKLEGIDGARVEIEATPTGWYAATPGGLRARLRDSRNAIICRVAPGADPELVQLGIGPASSRHCDTVYYPGTDRALVFRADGLSITPVLKGDRLQHIAITTAGPLTITVLDQYYRTHRDMPWFTPLNRRRFPTPPAGWCSWYEYYLGITEVEVIRNTDWLAEHLLPYGCDWVQIDDGWQGRGEGFGTNRDWFTTSKADFPHGMKWCADYIRNKGLRPGIWCIPFTQSNQAQFEERPALFVHNEDGTSPGERTEPLDYEWMPADERMVEWAGRYFIDPTGEEGETYLRELFAQLCKEWGYDYVKIDAQGGMVEFYNRHRPRLADPGQDGVHAYRSGLEVMRGQLGGNRFLLNCGAGWSSCGLCEGIRIGGDVEPTWKGMQPAITSTLQWLYLNTIAFYTDPDVVCVRESLPYEHAQLWATLLAVTGQLLMASDRMYALPEERVELLRRIFPVADIHPMELYPLDTRQKPGIFDVKIRRPQVGTWDVVALFNWDDEATVAYELSPWRLGLPEGKWLCLDAWSGQPIDLGDGSLTVEVPPTFCKVISYWPVGDVPQFIGTNRHLLQGATDVEWVKWDERRLRLTGVSDVVGNEPYHIKLYVPQGYRAVTRGVIQQGLLAELILRKDRNARLRWQVDFKQE